MDILTARSPAPAPPPGGIEQWLTAHQRAQLIRQYLADLEHDTAEARDIESGARGKATRALTHRLGCLRLRMARTRDALLDMGART